MWVWVWMWVSVWMWTVMLVLLSCAQAAPPPSSDTDKAQTAVVRSQSSTVLPNTGRGGQDIVVAALPNGQLYAYPKHVRGC